MKFLPDKRFSDSEENTIDHICRNLGIMSQDLQLDPMFRKEIGAEELDRLEKLFEQDQADR